MRLEFNAQQVICERDPVLAEVGIEAKTLAAYEGLTRFRYHVTVGVSDSEEVEASFISVASIRNYGVSPAFDLHACIDSGVVRPLGKDQVTYWVQDITLGGNS